MNIKKNNPSRQKIVNVAELNEKKRRHKKYKEDHPPYYFKDKPHQQMYSKNSPHDFWQMHGRYWVFNRCSDWTSNSFTIPEHKLASMEPYDRYNHCYMDYSDKECLCLVKYSSKKRHYCNQEEWKEIIDIIKKFTTFKRIIFCTLYDGRASAKIRDKEINFICNGGCEYRGISNMSITYKTHEEWQLVRDENGNYKRDERGNAINVRVTVPERKFIAEGYLFKIN